MISLFPYLSDLLSGLTITLILMIASLVMGLSLAILMTLCQYRQVLIVTPLMNGFIFFIRGTPLLVQLFLIYYGASQFEWLRHSVLWIFLRDPMICAIIALAINTACYTTILLNGAIHSVPRNEIAAAEALGMSKGQVMRRIIFPQVFRMILPAYSNEVIIILKCTSLASTITLLDIMGMTQRLIGQTYDTALWYAVAGTIYLLLNTVILIIFRMLRKTMHQSSDATP